MAFFPAVTGSWAGETAKDPSPPVPCTSYRVRSKSTLVAEPASFEACTPTM